MDPGDERPRVFKSFLPKSEKKLLLNQVEQKESVVCKRVDSKFDQNSSQNGLSMTKAAQQKRSSRQKVIYVDGKRTTNREIERKRDRM